METRKVDSIIIPLPAGLPLTPNVTTGEKITRAIELMLGHNVKRIAVLCHGRAIGMVRLEDAFQELGLKMEIRE